MLIDFGLSRIIQPGDSPTGGRGTPEWMAPEGMLIYHPFPVCISCLLPYPYRR